MTVEDLEANRYIRAIFARNWVNLQKLNYGATHGTVYVAGHLALLREPPARSDEERDRAGVSASFLMHLEKEILKVSGVRAVRWDIDGWNRTGGAWVHRGM